MKTTLKICAFLLLFILMGAGCKNDIPSEALGPGLVIYKTRNDYFNKMNINLLKGKVYYKPDAFIRISDDGLIYDKNRFELKNGYILASGDHSIWTAFLSYTIEEYYNMMEVQKIYPSVDELQNSIIDADPFIEYYEALKPGRFVIGDTAQINEIIRNGEIETYFKKLK